MRTGVHLVVAFQLETRTARKLVPNHHISLANRRSAPDVGRTVDRYDWRSDRNRSMHQPAVVADKQIALFDQSSNLLHRGLTRRQRDSAFQPARHFLNHRLLDRRTEQDDMRIRM